MKVALTAKGLDALKSKGPRTDYWDTLTPGLCIRVSGVTGGKTWYVRYRANGHHRRMKLGTYPGLTLAKARERARDAQTKADAGQDPALELQERKATDTTFGAMAREVLDAKTKTREAPKVERERILEAELLPYWKSRPADSITRREVVQLVERIAERAPTMANRTLALVKTLYNGALKRGFPTVEFNPAALIEPYPEEGRDRFLERGEIKAVWAATEDEAPMMRAIFRLTLLTAQRVGSVCAMRWQDIDASDVWTVPKDVFKGRRPHAVPLSAEARGILDELPRADDVYAFPAGRSDATEPHITSTNKALQRIRKASKLPRWTVHDFRRTFRTHATRSEKPEHENDPVGLGVAPRVADEVLGHLEGSLGRQRYTGDEVRYMLAEKRQALEAWGRFVRKAVEAKS